MSRTELVFGDDTRTYFGTEFSIRESAPIKGLPVSRKAKNPAAARVELVALLLLVAALSAIILVGVRNVSRQAQVASCVTNSSNVSQSVDALRAENNVAMPSSGAAWRQALLPGSTFVGAPFLKSWPHSRSYAVSVAGIGASKDTGDGLVPLSGDVLVTLPGVHKTYDATLHATVACAGV